MKYYFALRNSIVEKFVSSSGRRVILTNHTGSKEYFECIFIRKNDTRTIYTIDLEYTDYCNYVTNDGYISLTNGLHGFASAQLHMGDNFGGNVEEPYHYYHFAVTLREKLILTNGKDERVKSIRIVDIVKSNGTTIEFSLFDEKIMFRPNGTAYYVYSVKIPNKYLESFYLERNPFTKLLYSSDTVTGYNQAIVVVMYRSINGPKGLKDSMGLEERGTSLKNMWQPKTNWLYKPFSLKPVESECNITIDIPKDFIPHYSVADSKINMMEVFKEMSMFESDNRVRIPEIKKVIFNYPVTVVLWTDGTKTIVRYDPDKEKIGFDKEKAVAMCFVKKIYKDKFKSHWLDSISKAISEAPFNSPDIDVLERMAAKRVAEKKEEIAAKVNDLNEEINNNPPKSFEDIPEEKESSKLVKKNKIDQDLMLECIKEKLTIDEIAEMNSWDKAAVARMYYKITGTKPEKKPNTYSELDTLFEQGVSVDAAARRTGFSKNIVAMRYAKLQNRDNKE